MLYCLTSKSFQTKHMKRLRELFGSVFMTGLVLMLLLHWRSACSACVITSSCCRVCNWQK